MTFDLVSVSIIMFPIMQHVMKEEKMNGQIESLRLMPGGGA